MERLIKFVAFLVLVFFVSGAAGYFRSKLAIPGPMPNDNKEKLVDTTTLIILTQPNHD